VVLKEKLAVVVFFEDKVVDSVRILRSGENGPAFAELSGPSGDVNWGFLSSLLLAVTIVFENHPLKELVLPIQSAVQSHLMHQLNVEGRLETESSEAPF